jgi:hypothetical protein
LELWKTASWLSVPPQAERSAAQQGLTVIRMRALEEAILEADKQAVQQCNIIAVQKFAISFCCFSDFIIYS